MKWRIAYGFFRVIFGFVLLNVVGTLLLDVVSRLMSHELNQDPSDILYRFISSILTSHPLYVTYFLAVYFIFWGVLDIVLSYNLIKQKMWAFPVSFILISFFILYELIRYTHTHSTILLFIILLDALILWLIQRQYIKLRYRS